MKSKTIGKLMPFLLILSILALSSSCKTQKKKLEQEKMEEAERKAKEKAEADALKKKEEEDRKKAKEAERNRKIAEAKEILKRVKDDKTISVEDKKKMLAKIKAMNLQDKEIDEMIANLEETLIKQEEVVKEADKDLNTLLSDIAQATNVSTANKLITQTLNFFSSKETKVLIVISKFGNNEKDYDEPITIEKYLNYIKDVKQYNKKIETIEYDNAGKIKLLELINR